MKEYHVLFSEEDLLFMNKSSIESLESMIDS